MALLSSMVLGGPSPRPPAARSSGSYDPFGDYVSAGRPLGSKTGAINIPGLYGPSAGGGGGGGGNRYVPPLFPLDPAKIAQPPPNLTPWTPPQIDWGLYFGDTGSGDPSSSDSGGDPGSSDPGGYDYFGGNANYLAAQNAEQLGISQLDANLAEARRQAIIRFGDPALAGQAGFGLDPQAADFARQNYLSGNADLARLDKAHEQRRQAVIARLASHGILASGDLGYLQGQEDQTAGNYLYDAKNKVLDYLRTLNEQYLDRKNQLRQATLAAMQGAYGGGISGPTGAGGALENANQFNTGISGESLQAAAARYAAGRSYNGAPYVPGMVVQEGHTEVRNGVPGVYIKYRTGNGSSTEWTPIG